MKNVATDKDIKAACNLIRSARNTRAKANSRMKHKSITHKLSKAGGYQISNNVVITYDPKNDSIVTGHCLRYRNHRVSPGIALEKLECGNVASLNMLYRKREQQRKIATRVKIKRLPHRLSIEHGYQLTDGIDVIHDHKIDSVRITNYFIYSGYCIFRGRA